eukprot:gnl/TRDRNA2_/TRDRNA2_106936_c0_seq2.p1 gnl/TRDRNA2_/TRDRNA2_106936_c0~~gnl/TRDRNA2_/TRDRNA2_106936_c0_seq2.p1  ORF type:complete len:467 (+),score=96.22 gnl/TRDRNA2_/TRDRNA2_106936_c0_seq2:76-1476(+)
MIEEFVAKYELDAEAEAKLKALPHDIQLHVTAGFQPKDGTKDVNKLFHGYLKSLLGRAAETQVDVVSEPAKPAPTPEPLAHSDDVIEKCTSWCVQSGLDQQALDALLKLDIVTMEAVMTSFAPKPDTRNPSLLFMSFLKSHRDGPKGKGKGKGVSVAAGIGFAQNDEQALLGNTSLHASNASMMGMPGRGGFAAAAQPTEMEMVQFAQDHGLDERCLDALMSQEPQVQRQSIDSFAPKPGTRENSSLFMGFMKSIASRVRSERINGKGYQPVGGKGMTTGPVGPSLAEITQFAAAIGLDQGCVEIILSQTPSVQRQAIDEFRPKPDTRDPKSLFMGFMKSIAQRIGSNAPYVPAKAMSTADADRFGAEDWGANDDGGFGPAGLANGGLKRAAGDDPGPADIDQFVAHWGLDHEASSALEMSPPEVISEVLDTFSPKPGTRDVKSLFMGFLRSVSASGGSGKRLRPY